MRIGGIGLRTGVTLDTLESLVRSNVLTVLDGLATARSKAEMSVVLALAERLGLPLMRIPDESLAGQQTPTHSARVHSLWGTGSLCEAAALAGAGRNARLVLTRVVSADGRATFAIAEGEGA